MTYRYILSFTSTEWVCWAYTNLYITKQILTNYSIFFAVSVQRFRNNYVCWHLLPDVLQRNVQKPLIRYECGEDTSTCQIFRIFILCVLRKMPQTSNPTILTKSKWHQNEENQHTLTKLQSVLKCSGYISMPNCRIFLPRVLKKIFEKLKLDQFK